MRTRPETGRESRHGVSARGPWVELRVIVSQDTSPSPPPLVDDFSTFDPRSEHQMQHFASRKDSMKLFELTTVGKSRAKGNPLT